jgi:YggT family protein
VIVSVVATVAYYALLLYFFTMWARFILDLASNFARSWRPKGFGLVLAEAVFTLTDPPIRGVRRILPPIRLGGIALDFAWSIVMLGVIVLMYVTLVLRSV